MIQWLSSSFSSENAADDAKTKKQRRRRRQRLADVSSKRYYYTDRRLFEQSLDVYHPNHPDRSVTKESDSDDDRFHDCEMVVLLTVGSGWVGHVPWIYRVCAWWNASGPRTVAAALQCPCVCIRHRGRFPQAHVLLATIVTVVALIVPSWLVWFMLSCGHEDGKLPFMDGALLSSEGLMRWVLSTGVSLWVVLWSIMIMHFRRLARESATLEDMVDDVARAVAWTRTNYDDTIRAPSGCRRPTNRTALSWIFGGYSSGGHVSATLLQKPISYWKRHGLMPPREMFSAIVYISGVLATHGDDDFADKWSEPKTMNAPKSVNDGRDGILVSNGGAGNRDGNEFDSRQRESPVEGLASNISPDTLPDSDETASSTSLPPPVWLTNFICRTVWGGDWRTRIPSPLHQPEAIPAIPHLLIENRHEVFGLRWLDTFFCASAYRQRLLAQQQQQEQRDEGDGTVPAAALVTLRRLESDHWNVLASSDLYEAIREEIPRLVCP